MFPTSIYIHMIVEEAVDLVLKKILLVLLGKQTNLVCLKEANVLKYCSKLIRKFEFQMQTTQHVFFFFL